MSAQEGHPPHPSITHHEAGVQRLERVLRSHGPLTRHTLLDFAGARRWPDDAAFDAALEAAVAAGPVRSLGGVLFEAADGAPTDPFTAAREPAATER
jgi:hypothetical protein